MDLRRIAQTIANDLERETCRTCNKHPKLTVTGSTDKPSINVNACCNEFVKIIQAKVTDQLNSKTKVAVEAELKNMFKNFGK